MKFNELEKKGIEGFLKGLTVKSVSYDNEDTFKVIASTGKKDRDWEVLDSKWWDFDDYLNNPVIVANHDYKVENIVWKATSIYMENNKLIVEWVFSKTEKGIMFNKLYNEWFLKGVSVWYITKEIDPLNSSVILKQELIELSFVAVPCNPEAISLDKKDLEKYTKEGWLRINTTEELDDKKKEEEKEEGEKESDIIIKKLEKVSNALNDMNEKIQSLEKSQEEQKENTETRDVKVDENIEEIIKKSIKETFGTI